jgi:hypothetical protein
MNLQPGCRLAVAPRFHLPADWTRRLLLGAGVTESEGHFFPEPSWRPPQTNELPLLARGPEEPTSPTELAACVCLFQLAGHLRSAWWDLLEQAAEALGDGPLPGFPSFADRVGAFLDFKGIPLPDEARCDVVVSNPGQQLVRWGPAAFRPAGLVATLAPATPWPEGEFQRGPRLWGAINLGDAETSLVLINLSCPQLAVELGRRFADQPAPRSVGELAERFLRSCPDYPPLRLILGPGEGCRFPVDGMIFSSHRGDKQEPDVLLWISHQPVQSC